MSEHTPIRIRPSHPATVTLDDRELQIRVRRFGVDDLATYSRLESAMSEQREDRVLLVRKTAEELERVIPTETQGDEHAALLERATALEAQAASKTDAFVTEVFGFLRSVVARLKPVERYRVPDDEIRRRRDQELTSEQRAQLDAYREEEQQAAAAFMTFVVGEFITIVPGQIELEEDVPQPDGQEPTIAITKITSGADVLKYFGGRTDLLRQLMQAVRRENLMTEQEKNAWRSRSGSTRSSGERGQAVGGPTPEPVAPPVASEPSARSAAAMASTEALLSGPTGAGSN